SLKPNLRHELPPCPSVTCSGMPPLAARGASKGSPARSPSSSPAVLPSLQSSDQLPHSSRRIVLRADCLLAPDPSTATTNPSAATRERRRSGRPTLPQCHGGVPTRPEE